MIENEIPLTIDDVRIEVFRVRHWWAGNMAVCQDLTRILHMLDRVIAQMEMREKEKCR